VQIIRVKVQTSREGGREGGEEAIRRRQER